MKDVLHNPVFNALQTGDRAFASGTDTAKYFDQEVSPFAGFEGELNNGFAQLAAMLPSGRRILFAKPEPISQPAGWKIKAHIPGLQFVYDENQIPAAPALHPTPLSTEHVPEMMSLTALTKPGPFASRTIEFGHYHGIFENGRLAAMTGQRLHVNDYTELSAVCTHPDFLGKGYAGALMLHQIRLILDHQQKPFLHVRADNERAISLYKRLGFRVNRDMHFYFMQRD